MTTGNPISAICETQEFEGRRLRAVHSTKADIDVQQPTFASLGRGAHTEGYRRGKGGNGRER